MCEQYLNPMRRKRFCYRVHIFRIVVALQTLLLPRTTLCQSHNVLFPVLLTALSHFHGGRGYNLDVNFSTIATDSNNNSYFGFSVGLSTADDESWLLVGAPKSLGDGQIFKCRYDVGRTASNCTVIDLRTKEKGGTNVGAMLGFTMLPGPDEKELLVCAPHFTVKSIPQSHTVTDIENYDLVGICYLLKNFNDSEEPQYKIYPCVSDKGTNHDGDAFGQCQLGFSAAFTKDEGLLLGAPRVQHQGSVIVFNSHVTGDIMKHIPLYLDSVTPTIPASWNESDFLAQSFDENYVGYAIATATSKYNELLLVGSPARLRNDLLGMVQVVYSANLESINKFIGRQMGENFGSAIAAVDLNNDTLEDIIIGAPHYSSHRKIYESGRIFVYYQHISSEGNIVFSEPVIIYGTKSRGQFGYALAAIGDIDQDGYSDIAVGAPYTTNVDGSEHADGSVFIFNGGPDGIVPKASQEIKGIDIDDSISTFGFSIYGDKDMDRNSYPDVIVGAYASGHAVMIRSRPVVVIQSNVTMKPGVVDLDNPTCDAEGSSPATICSHVTTCFKYAGENVPESLDILYSYDVDSGKSEDKKNAFILNETLKTTTLTRYNGACVYEYVYIKPDIKDKLSDIVFTVSHSLIPKNKPVQPVLDHTEPTYSLARLKIKKDCGEDDICNADLRLRASLDVTELYAGRMWPFVMQHHIQNKGEAAFLSTLFVYYPKEVEYVGILKNSKLASTLLCDNGNGSVTCEVGNPLKRNADVRVNLKFQTTLLKGRVSKLTFKSLVNSTSSGNNESGMKKSELDIKVMSNIYIVNISRPGVFYLENQATSGFKKNKTTVYHTYEVINKGPSDYSEATIELKWPMRTKDGRELLHLVEIKNHENIRSCSQEEVHPDLHRINAIGDSNSYYCDGRAECALVRCRVQGILDHLEVNAEFYLSSSAAVWVEHDSHVQSELHFSIDRYPYTIKSEGQTHKSTATTAFLYRRSLPPKELQWWIIAVAVVIGIFCVLIMVLVFWKCGFFKRKKIPKTVEETDEVGDDMKTEVEVLHDLPEG